MKRLSVDIDDDQYERLKNLPESISVHVRKALESYLPVAEKEAIERLSKKETAPETEKRPTKSLAAAGGVS